jgi:YVTN family beta-propeller protein
MTIAFRLFAFAVICWIVGLPGAASAEKVKPDYTLTDTLPLPGSTRWDYLAFDAMNSRLFITRGDNVAVLDTHGKKIIATIPNLDGVHGVALAPGLNKGFITEGKANRVAVFDLKTFGILAKIPTGNKPDAVVYDEATGRVFAADGDSGELTVIDAANNQATATIKLDGQPEFAVVDGAGTLYVNLEDKSQIAVVDTRALKLVAHYDLARACDGPTGLAMDKARQRLFTVCANKNMLVVDAGTGKILDTLPIGAHSDAAVFDAATNFAFSSNGDGTLTVVGPADNGHYRVLDTAKTKVTARTMALDPLTHTIYMAAADTEGFDPPTEKNPEPHPHIKPDTFMILTVSASP